MPRKVIAVPDWVPQACALMVKYELSLRAAAAELGQNITIEEAEALKDRKLFKEALEAAHLSLWQEIGSDPRVNREALRGQMLKLANRLAADREDYKAADVLLKVAKVSGWVGEPEHKPSLLDSLTQTDIDTLRAQIKRAQEQGQGFDLAKAIVEIKAPKVN